MISLVQLAVVVQTVVVGAALPPSPAPVPLLLALPAVFLSSLRPLPSMVQVPCRQ